MAAIEPRRALLRALDKARPDAIAAVLRDVVAQQFGATTVQILLADHQLSTLRPVGSGGAAAAIDDSAAGEAFTTQRTVTVPRRPEGVRVHLPVSVGGDRMGVLRLDVPQHLTDEQLDQLSDLATLSGYALNATSRQTDLLHRAARSHRMTLGAELQWQLIPARARVAPEYQLAGHLEPAYAVYADNFDWSDNDGTLLVSITDAANHARTTPLLTTLAVTAARNARRAGLGVADQACLADQAIYAHHQGAHSVDSLLLSIDIATGRASVVKAGSPDLVLLRDGLQQPIELVDQIPLGMFEATDYVTQSFNLTTGDRLVLVSDGVTRALSTPATHGRDRMAEILSNTLEDAPTRVVRTIIDALIDHPTTNGLTDDATVVCVDWMGPGEPSAVTLSAFDTALPSHRHHLHAVPMGASE